jgi:uncharacterized membrane protein YoaK (UPF0700 family)
MVLMLTWAAGGVDAISYLGLGHVFTANMTGNAVLLGLAIGQGQGLAALRSLVALAGFALGAAIGALVVERGAKHGHWPRGVTAAISVEGFVLGLFTITWHTPGTARSGVALYALIALSAVAMGIQSAAIRHLNVPGVATTYITGTLTSFVAGLVGWLGAAEVSSLGTKSAGDPGISAAAAKKHAARLQATVFFVYGVAAVASGFLQARSSALVTLSPLIAVALVVANALMRHRHE